MSSRAPKFLPPAALQAEVLRTDKLRSSCQIALQKSREVNESAREKVTAALGRLETSKLQYESLSEDKAAVQVDLDILAHLVKALTASQQNKEAEIQRLVEELSHVEEELLAGEKDLQTCKGVEELSKSSLSESEEKYKKAQQEYEMTYARANPPPEPVSPPKDSAADGDKKTKHKESRTEPRKKRRSASPRRDARSRSQDRKHRKTRSRSRSAERKRRKSPAPLKISGKESTGKGSAKKASKEPPKPEKPRSEQGKGSTLIGEVKPADAGTPPTAAAGQHQASTLQEQNGMTPQETPLTANVTDPVVSEALPNGDKKGETKDRSNAGETNAQPENGHASKEKVAGSGSDRDGSADSSKRSRSPSDSPPKQRRRSASSRSVSSASTGRGRRRKGTSRSPSSSPRRRRRTRSDSPPLRRRRSGSRRRSLSRSRSRTRAQRSPGRLKKIDSHTMELFRTSLRKCLEHHMIPFNISLINDVMRKEDRTWNIRNMNTTFLTFMKKLEDEGYVDLATRGSTTMVAGSARYRDIIEATMERMRLARIAQRVQRSQSRSRLRSPPPGRRRSRSPLRARRSPSRGRSRSPRRHRSETPGKGGERWALGGGGGERWEMT